MAIVSQLARKHVTVSLSGDGGDELFAGYNRYVFTENIYNKTQKIPGPARKIIALALSIPAPATWDKLYSIIMALRNQKGAAAVGLKLHKLAAMLQQAGLDEAYQYLCSYWQQPTDLLRQTTGEPDLMANYGFNRQFLDSAMQWDQDYYLPGDNLVKTDRASMAVSLEMRLPLLDQAVVEFAWRIPNSMKIRDQKSKWLLRQVLYRYVPQELIERPKMGFSVPVAEWIRGDLKDWAYELLNPTLLQQQNLFNASEIESAYHQHLNGQFDHSHKLWTVLMFQAWYQQHIGSAQ
jgi:asparagine synthase (glutamine-hydrolysing)